MITGLGTLWAVFAGGCVEGVDGLEPAEPVTVDGSCGTEDYGYDEPTDAARSALERANCYRNLMGLEPGVLDPLLDDASQAHADYMEQGGTITHEESADQPGFTGQWPGDRIEAAGYALSGNIQWSEVISQGADPAQAIDFWVMAPYHRYPFTLSRWHAAGFGQAGTYASMCFVAPFPDEARGAVIFPVDGQRDVPTSFDSDTEWPDPAPDHGVVGYPITVTVYESEMDYEDGSNPHGLALVGASLMDEHHRPVEVLARGPAEDDYLWGMVLMVPVAPLEPNSAYTAVVTLEWGGVQETEFSRFVTGSD